MRKKVSIIGAGNVGATAGQLIAQSGLADIVLFDIVSGMPQGKALDMSEACPLWGSSVSIKGTNKYEDTSGSDIVVITGGLPRKPGMSRDDLLHANINIVTEVARNISGLSPEAKVIVVTNPMDVMTYAVWKASGLEHEKVMGMGGVLDSSRLRAFIAWKLGVSASDVKALVMGGHGDDMVPLKQYTTINGIPVTGLLNDAEIDALIERTRNGGAEVIKLLQQGSAYYAPAAAVFEMVKAILLDEKKVLPCAAYLTGQYGISGMYFGVPAVIGKDGVERIIELKLNTAEREGLDKSLSSVRTMIEKLGGL